MNKNKLLANLGLPQIFRWINRHRVPVLMYHGVLPDGDPLAEDSWLQVKESEFRWQMAYMKEHYEVIHLSEALKQGSRSKGKPRAVITFDDGYANNYYCALPILKEFQIPATIFVTTSHVDTDKMFWWDRLRITLTPIVPLPKEWIEKLKTMKPSRIDSEINSTLEDRGLKSITVSPESYRCLTSVEIRSMIDDGLIQIGSHTHCHDILERLDPEEVRTTLRNSTEKLREWGIETNLFAAPNGTYLDAQIPLIKAENFASCVSTYSDLWSCPSTPYRIPRCPVGRGADPAWFALLISGVIPFLRKIMRKEKKGGY